MVFNSGSHNYTINGPGSIAIATNLTQQAGADVTINANVNTPVTRVTAGTLLVGSSNYTSTSRVDVSNAALVVNGTLNTPQVNINASSALTVGSSGSIGSATLTLGTNATATFNNATQATPSLTSSTGNVITLNGTAFSVAAATAYSGSIRRQRQDRPQQRAYPYSFGQFSEFHGYRELSPIRVRCSSRIRPVPRPAPPP